MYKEKHGGLEHMSITQEHTSLIFIQGWLTMCSHCTITVLIFTMS